jgi:hypothetical protein
VRQAARPQPLQQQPRRRALEVLADQDGLHLRSNAPITTSTLPA